MGRCWVASKFAENAAQRCPPPRAGHRATSDRLPHACRCAGAKLQRLLSRRWPIGWGSTASPTGKRGSGLAGRRASASPKPRDAWSGTYPGPAALRRSTTWFAGIGQGWVAATPLQMANVAATIARGGLWVRPTLLEEGPDGLPRTRAGAFGDVPERVDLHIPPEAMGAAWVGMFNVVNGKAGTGTGLIAGDRAAGGGGDRGEDWHRPGRATRALKNAMPRGTRSSGPTASPSMNFSSPRRPSSPTPGPWYRGSGAENHDLAHAWYIGFAPAKHPQIAFAVMVEYGGSGGVAAAAIARDTARSVHPAPLPPAKVDADEADSYRRPETCNGLDAGKQAAAEQAVAAACHRHQLAGAGCGGGPVEPGRGQHLGRTPARPRSNSSFSWAWRSSAWRFSRRSTTARSDDGPGASTSSASCLILYTVVGAKVRPALRSPGEGRQRLDQLREGQPGAGRADEDCLHSRPGAVSFASARTIGRSSGLVPPFALAVVPVVLILKQPDLGMAMLFLPILLAMLFVAGAKIGHLAAVLDRRHGAGAAGVVLRRPHRSRAPPFSAADQELSAAARRGVPRQRKPRRTASKELSGPPGADRYGVRWAGGKGLSGSFRLVRPCLRPITTWCLRSSANSSACWARQRCWGHLSSCLRRELRLLPARASRSDD